MRNKNFFMIPNRIFSLGLKPKEFVVYCCLVQHSDRVKNRCFPSRRLIAQECNMDKKTVDSAIKGLEEQELAKGLEIDPPKNYFRDEARTQIVQNWHSTANIIYSNWLNYYVYQVTPFDLEKLK